MFKNKKLVLLAFFILLLYCVSSLAAPFDVNAVPINDKIAIDENAKYRIEITNNLDKTDEYRIYSLDYPVWDVRTEPIANPITLVVSAKSSGSIDVLIDPLYITQIGAYSVNLNVRSKLADEAVIVPVEVGIKSTDILIGGYVPTVVTSVDIPSKIDPKDEVTIKIVLNNQNIINYSDMVIKLESELIKDEILYSLGPKEEKTLTISKQLDPLTPLQKDKLMVSVFKGERLIAGPIVVPFEIVEYGKFELIDSAKGFLKTKKSYIFTSNNKNYEGTAKVETSLFRALFTLTNPKAKILTENGKKYFAWDIKLEGNSLRINVTENLLPLLVVIVLLVVLAILYYVFRSPLTIKKEAKNVIKSHGGISELKVVLTIRNRGKNTIREIELTERLPHIIDVEREVSIGSLQPSKILRHEKKGHIIKWLVDKLDPSEERVLSYKIKSRLPILGDFSLSAAGSKFHYNGKIMISSSNRLIVSS